MTKRRIAVLATLSLAGSLLSVSAAAAGTEDASIEVSTNSIGMDLVDIPSGTFLQGTSGPPRDDQPHLDGRGYLDEEPQHEVNISSSFKMSATPVTNAQYEEFDPDHALLRDKLGFSSEDDEAVVFVSWHDAVEFTEWLSEKEGVTYRLPTEAEWEYAARAGTTTDYWTGDELPEEFWLNQQKSWFPGVSAGHEDVSLQVGQTPANPFGLHDVHGLVEEWVLDWYGPYEEGVQNDPVGRVDGEFKVTRGGSHSTQMETEGAWPTYLRSASRAGTIPETRNWATGFRVVQGELPQSEPLPEPDPDEIFQDVSQERVEPEGPTDDGEPYFEGPRSFINLETAPRGPFFGHNHQPAVTEMPNGDLMAIWYSTEGEEDRILKQAGARLRHGESEWDEASVFWDAPGRNVHGNELWWDGEETLYHWSGISALETYGALALVQRTSTDNGATWSKPELIQPEHGLRNQVIAAATQLSDGRLLLPADATPSSGTAVHISDDGGETWWDPGTDVLGDAPITEEMHEANAPEFVDGGSGNWIAGFHASIAELSDGRLLALGRGDSLGEAEEKEATRSPSMDGFGNAVTLGAPEPNAVVDMPEGVLSDVDDFTIATWIKRNTMAGQNWSRVFDFASQKGNGMFLAIEGGGTGPRFTIESPDTSGQQTVTSPEPLGQGWNHLAVTKSGDTVTIFVNGEAVGESDEITLNPSDLGETAYNWIGRSIYGDPTLNASIDEFRILHGALEADEVGDLMDNSLEVSDSQEVLRYSFDEDGGSHVEDSSGNEHHGLIDTTFNFNGWMPQSISDDRGETWSYSSSEFEPLEGGQRGFLLELEEDDALMFATFAPMTEFTDENGDDFVGSGLFTAVSLDDGETWPYKRLVSHDGAPEILDEGAGRGEFVLSPFSSERYGYLTGLQARDGVVHLLSSGNHYAFDYDWLTSPAPAACVGEIHVDGVDTTVEDRRLSGAFRGETSQGANRKGTWHDACLSHMLEWDPETSDHEDLPSHVKSVVSDLLEREYISEEEAAELLAALAETPPADGGSLAISAEFEGPGAELWAGAPLEVAVFCSADAGSDLPDGLTVRLSEENSFSSVVDALPIGAECDVTVVNDGAATRTTLSPNGGSVVIEEENDAQTEVTVTSIFETKSVQATKVIEGETQELQFETEMQCVHPGLENSDPLAIPGGEIRQLTLPNQASTVYENLPVGSTCQLTELDDAGAERTLMFVEDSSGKETESEGTSVDLELADHGIEEPVKVTITNIYSDDEGSAPIPGEDNGGAQEQEPDGGSLPSTGAFVLPLLLATLGVLALGVVFRRASGKRKPTV